MLAPKAFSSARPVAEASLGEYMDITLNQRVDPEALLAELAEKVPTGFRVFGVAEVPLKAPSLMSSVAGMDYVVIVDGETDQWEPVVAGLLVRDRIEVERRNKKKKLKKPIWKLLHNRSLNLANNHFTFSGE